uniref:Uncharacterized protein n=1 Tax=Sexangularia sp. CB-2014 TaxID=1486929 RepID=A0A7S1V830_9EUKA
MSHCFGDSWSDLDSSSSVDSPRFSEGGDQHGGDELLSLSRSLSLSLSSSQVRNGNSDMMVVPVEGEDEGWNPFVSGSVDEVGQREVGRTVADQAGGATADAACRLYDVRIRPMSKKVTRDARDDVIEREAGASQWGDLPWVSLGKGRYMVGVKRVTVDEQGLVHLTGSKARGSMTVTDFLNEWGERERRRHSSQRSALTMIFHRIRS